MVKTNQLSVRLNNKSIGVLEQLPNGKMNFTYLESAASPISLSMPLRLKPYNESLCEAFFGGLLPENLEARRIIAKSYGVSSNNIFSLLKAIGYDCAGALSFHEINSPLQDESDFFLRGKEISDNDLYDHIKLLPKKPLFLGLEGLRLSLAGVQDKAAVCIIDNKIMLPTSGCPTTHILKPQVRGFEGLVENEFYCMRIASRIGLPAPTVEIKTLKDIVFLLIERYDRIITNNKVQRVHQEDFCQALGISPDRKYQKEGGPSFKSCFLLLNQTSYPAIDRNRLASALVYNYLIGNMDAHGKNFSLTYKSSTRLAPLYDLICTSVYPDLTKKMAMKIGSQYQADFIFPRHWEKLCEEINYSYPALKKLIKNYGEKILISAQIEKDHLNQMGLKTTIVERVFETMNKQIEKTMHNFELEH